MGEQIWAGTRRRMRAHVPSLDQVDITALQQFIVDAYAKIEPGRLQFSEERAGSHDGRLLQRSPENHIQSRWRP